MPEALRSVDQYDLDDEPRPRARPQARKPAKAPEKPPGLFRSARSRPGRTLVAGLFIGVLVGIVANATLMQGARHPAPIFAGAAPAPVPAPAAPLPPPRPSDTASIPAAVGKGAPAATTMAGLIRATAAAPGREAPEAAGPRKDPIAALLKNDAPPEKSNKVALVQRALLKVGFAVKTDGNFGAGTKQAIERFERDRSLPVTGDMTPRTLRELSAQSGVAIQ